MVKFARTRSLIVAFVLRAKATIFATNRSRLLATVASVAVGAMVIAVVFFFGSLASPSQDGAVSADSDSGTSDSSVTRDAGSRSGTSSGAEAGNTAYTPPAVPAAERADYLVGVVDADVAATLAKNSALNVVILSSSGGKATIAVPAAQQAAVVAAAPSAALETNSVVSASTTENPTPSWGIDRIDQNALPLNNSYTYDTTGAGVPIYVVDTGLFSANSEFAGRIRAGYSVVADGRGTEDCNGHGTHVSGTAAGTIYGVAKQATIVPVRVLDCNGSGYVSDIVTALNWIVSTSTGGPAVINMSLGGGASATLNAAVQNAISKGFVVVVAAGNSSADACLSSPSGVTEAITVGASTSTDALASYSNRGSCVDIIAPGSAITSAYLGTTAVLSGTSMASPHVAGAAARLLQANAGLGTSGVIAALKAQGAQGVVSGVPAGTVNTLLVLPLNAVTPTPTASATPKPSATPTPSVTPKPSATPTPTPSVTPKPSPTPTTPAPAPALVLGAIKATAASATQVSVSWTVTSGTFSGFTLVVKNNTTGQVSQFKLAGASRSVTLTGTKVGTTYDISISGSATVSGKTVVSNTVTTRYQ